MLTLSGLLACLTQAKHQYYSHIDRQCIYCNSINKIIYYFGRNKKYCFLQSVYRSHLLLYVIKKHYFKRLDFTRYYFITPTYHKILFYNASPTLCHPDEEKSMVWVPCFHSRLVCQSPVKGQFCVNLCWVVKHNVYSMSQWMVILCSTDINVLKGYSQNYFILYRWIINRDERENRREERGQTNPKCAFSWNKNNTLTEHWTYLNTEEWCIFVSKTFQAFLCMWRWWW